ncbi:hypothetical protein LPZ50_16195, partial [Bordetella petrii]|nr:hypothetical protein [Bordetella petrii]
DTAAAQAGIAGYAYYAVFCAWLALAFWLGASRASAGLLWASAALNAAVPLSSAVSFIAAAHAAPYLQAYFFVDSFFAIAAVLLGYLAYRAQRRYRQGPRIFPASPTRIRPQSP